MIEESYKEPPAFSGDENAFPKQNPKPTEAALRNVGLFCDTQKRLNEVQRGRLPAYLIEVLAATLPPEKWEEALRQAVRNIKTFYVDEHVQAPSPAPKTSSTHYDVKLSIWNWPYLEK